MKSLRSGGRIRTVLRNFLRDEATGGLMLMAAALCALVIANSALAPAYFDTLATHVGGLSVLHWINDALMAVFFLLVGLEIKREMIGGQLATWSARALPGLAAAGGMIVPSLIYLAINASSPATLRGWAIPSATDIAFALGVLSFFGNRVPYSLTVVLTALAILDDLGAVVIIALFYTSNIEPLFLLASLAAVALLIAFNRFGVTRLWPYLIAGLVLWFFVLKSGVHATLAGVMLALTIPGAGGQQSGASPLDRLERLLQPFVSLGIVPIFGFANAGVSLAGFGPAQLLQPVPLGVALGLFVGKQAGVFAFTWLAVKLRLAQFPHGASWPQFYGVALLCGIGFTMSLFIGLLAFPGDQLLQDEMKIGVLAGSLASSIVGAIVLIAAGRGSRT